MQGMINLISQSSEFLFFKETPTKIGEFGNEEIINWRIF